MTTYEERAFNAETMCDILEKQLAECQALLGEYRTALANYAECSDGCTCGDGWSHNLAIEALALEEVK